jgi:hypothetical protein
MLANTIEMELCSCEMDDYDYLYLYQIIHILWFGGSAVDTAIVYWLDN